MSLFARRTTLFHDFLHLTCLFIGQKVSLDYYIQLWSRIFRFISKKLHTRFLSFAKTVFELIALSYPRYQKKRIFRGVRFVISGRFKAKARASSHSIKFGILPTQSICKQIQFSNLKVHTLYGIFGIKIWCLIDKLHI
jgi:ribosomal protein S3